MKKKLLFIGAATILCSCIDRTGIDKEKNCLHLSRADAENIAIFPASHPLNMAIDTCPVDNRSEAIISFLSENNPSLQADFGSGLYDGAPIGIPYAVVCRFQPKVKIVFRANGYDGNYGAESDPGPYPIPLDAPVEGNGNGDSHVIAVDVDNLKLYELYNAEARKDFWEASSGAVFNLTKVEYRPLGWTSADAAGLPIFPCLVRYDEVISGEIDHAIRFTLPLSKVMRGFISPARHLVNGNNRNLEIPTPFGMRLRLKPSFDISSFSPVNQVILQAMKRFGIILADVGSSFYITGAPDNRWDNDDLQNLKKIKATDFEVVRMGDIVTW